MELRMANQTPEGNLLKLLIREDLFEAVTFQLKPKKMSGHQLKSGRIDTILDGRGNSIVFIIMIWNKKV